MRQPFIGWTNGTILLLVARIWTFGYENERITELCLTGVCTDICVLHTAVDAYNLGYQLMIPEHAVASFDEQGHEWALRHFKQTLGATIL